MPGIAQQLVAINASPAVIFDFNGTLSDDERELEAAYDTGLAALGLLGLQPGEYAQLVGRSDPDIAAALCQARGVDAPAQLLGAVAAAYAASCIATPRIAPETVSWLRWLHAAGVSLGIATGTLRELLLPALRAAGIAELFSALVTIEDVPRGKPDPAGFRLCLDLINAERRAQGLAPVSPQECWVVEDSRAGLVAAQDAGMPVLLLGSAGVAPQLATVATAALSLSSWDNSAAAVVSSALRV